VLDEKWVDFILTECGFAGEAGAVFLGEEEEASPAEWR
jgi:hypothetical protein